MFPRFGKNKGTLGLALLVLCASTWATDLRVYTVGNSLTDGLGIANIPAFNHRDMLARLTASSGANTIDIGKCNTAGAPLDWLWQYIDHTALSTNGPWDVLTLQTYGTRPLYDPKYPGDHSHDWGVINNSKNFIHYALPNNPHIQPYVYSHWPKVPGYKRHTQYMDEGYTWEEADALRQQALVDFEEAGGWDAAWNTLCPDPSYGNPHCRGLFEQFMDILNTERHIPGDPIENLTRDVLLIPVGDVFYEMNQRMKTNPTMFPKATSASGGYYTNIVEMQADEPHLRPGVGRFIGGAVWYATLYGKNPAGLDYTIYNDPNPSTGQYYDYADPYYEEITADFAAAVYDVVWDVVSTHPRAGIATADADGDSLPDWWETEYYGGATNANPAAMASNGIDTVQDAYIAGLDPNDPDDTLTLSPTFSPSPSNPVLQWNGKYGRVYSIYWTTNLLGGFGSPIESNLPYSPGSYTDTNHSGDTEGFYKITAELE